MNVPTIILLIILAGIESTMAQIKKEEPALNTTPRIRFTINDGWRFYPGDVIGAEKTTVDDSNWERVNLPHTWNARDAFDKRQDYRRGIGWYRMSLTIGRRFQDKKLFLYFEGANQVADVYVNGKHAGRHLGGYTAFVFEITPLVVFDRANLIAVKVDNRHNEDIPPLNADFTFYGGIYRDAWLIATAPVYIEVLDHASPGVFIDIPVLSKDRAVVRLRGAVRNSTERNQQVEIVSRVIDAENREFAKLKSELQVPSSSSKNFEQQSDVLKNPRLWSPTRPYLYRVVTDVSVNGGLSDHIENPLGMRWFGIDAQKGYSLNGEPLKLYGANRHQDYEGYGNAVPNDLHRRDMHIIKENGFNFLRLAHYPQDPVVLACADQLGLIVWEEIPVVNIITLSEKFNENAERMLVEMIRQHYNHPSILIWGYMNEVMLVKPQPMPEDYYDRVVALAKSLEARVHAEDSTRATATALSYGEIDNGTGFGNIPDILGMNLYFGWYYEKLETLGAFLDDLHKRFPERPLLISEYGAGSDERVHALTPQAFDFSTEHQQNFHEASFRQIQERPYLLGSAVWNQFDFGSIHRQDTKHSINNKGLYYFDRHPKDAAFYYSAQLKTTPVMHIATRDWTNRAGSTPEDRSQPLMIYTNLEKVELLVNGNSLGVKSPANCAARWSMPLAHGKNFIRTKGRYKNEVIEDAVTIHYTDYAPFFSISAAPIQTFAVNVGSHTQFIDDAAVVWLADRPYQPGSLWGYIEGKAVETHHRIFGTQHDPLYQTAREGMSGYRFDVPDGSYEIQIGCAEIIYDESGQRVFSVYINESPLFIDADLTQQYGRYFAVERSGRVQVNDGEGIIIRFEPRKGEAVASAIRIRRL